MNLIVEFLRLVVRADRDEAHLIATAPLIVIYS